MYKVEYTKRFLKELSRLPPQTQSQAERIVFEDLPSKNPFQLGYVDPTTTPGVAVGQLFPTEGAKRRKKMIVPKRDYAIMHPNMWLEKFLSEIWRPYYK